MSTEQQYDWAAEDAAEQMAALELAANPRKARGEIKRRRKQLDKQIRKGKREQWRIEQEETDASLRFDEDGIATTTFKQVQGVTFPLELEEDRAGFEAALELEKDALQRYAEKLSEGDQTLAKILHLHFKHQASLDCKDGEVYPDAQIINNEGKLLEFYTVYSHKTEILQYAVDEDGNIFKRRMYYAQCESDKDSQTIEKVNKVDFQA